MRASSETKALFVFVTLRSWRLKFSMASSSSSNKSSGSSSGSGNSYSNSYYDQWNQMNEQIKKNATSNSSSGNSSSSSSSTVAKIFNTIDSFYVSFSFSASAGIGFGKSVNAGVCGATAVAKIDVIGYETKLGQSSSKVTQEASLGGSIFGFGQTAQLSAERLSHFSDIFTEGFGPWSTDPEWANTSGVKTSYSLGMSSYFGIGGGFGIEFNANEFEKKFREIW